MARSSQERICRHQTGSMFDGDKFSHSYSSNEMRNGLSDSSFKVQCYQKTAFMNNYDTRLKNDCMLKNRHSFAMDYGTQSSLSQNFGSGTRAGGGWGEPRQNTMLDNNCGQYSFIGSIPYNPAFCKLDTTPSSSRYAPKNANFFYTPQSNVKQRIGGTSMEYEGRLNRSLTFSSFSTGTNSGENVPFQDSFKSNVPKYSSTLLGAGGSPEIHAKHCTVYNEMLFDKNLSTFRESSLYRSISECENSYHKPKTLPKDQHQIKSNGAEKVVGNHPSGQKQDDMKCSIKSCDNSASNSDPEPVRFQNNWCNVGVTAEESACKESELIPQEEENRLNSESNNNDDSNNALSVTSSLTFCKDSNDATESKLNTDSDTSVDMSNSPRSQYKEISEQNCEKQVGNWMLPIVKPEAKWTRITQKLSAGEIGKQSLYDAKKKDQKWTRITQKLSAEEIKTETHSDSEEDDEKWSSITQKLNTQKQTLCQSKKEDKNSEDNEQSDNENITPEGNPEQITHKQKQQNSLKKETDQSLASLTEEILSAIREEESLLNRDNVTSSDHNTKVDNKGKEVCDKSEPKQFHCKHDIPVSKSKSQLRYDLETASSEIRGTSGTNQCLSKVLGKEQNVKKDSQESMKEEITGKQQPNRRAVVRTAAIFGQYPSGLEKAKDKISDASGKDQHNSLQTKEEVPHNKASGINEVTSSKMCDERRPSTILLQKLRDKNNHEEKETEESVQETMEEQQLKGSASSTTFTISQERWSAAKKRNISKLAWEQWCAMKREKELQSKKKEVVDSKTKLEQQQKMEEEKRKKQEEIQESYERWLRDKREKDKEKKRIAAKKTAEEKRKEAIERKREQRREEFKEAFQTWVKEKDYKLLEQKHQIEEAKRRKEEEEKERKRQCEKAFEEWKMKAVDRPKPMSVKIYDPLIQKHPSSSRPMMFINPKPWASDF